MVNKRQMRQLISRGRREQIERNRLESIASMHEAGMTIFEMSTRMDLSVSEIKRLVKKLNKINMMPTNLPAKLKKEGS